MTHHSQTLKRIENAHPSTWRAIRYVGLWTVISLSLSSGAAIMAAVTPLKILVHPPEWFVVLAHLAALAVGLLSGFIYAYMSPDVRRWKLWTTAVLGAALLYALTFSAKVCAGPVISTIHAPTSSTRI
jgi:hypothetical protein